MIRQIFKFPTHSLSSLNRFTLIRPQFQVHFFSSRDENDKNFLETLDISLTPEQKSYVEKLKKKIRGGINSPKSPYTTPPNIEDVPADGNLYPLLAPNAEELIDYALSHVHPRAGPRRSREKRRRKHRFEQIVANHKRRKEQTRIAIQKKNEKWNKHVLLAAYYKDLSNDPASIRGNSRLPSKEQLDLFAVKYKEMKLAKREEYSKGKINT